MKQVAFKMKLFPGLIEEYKKRHDKIWPELLVLLKENGVANYSIFFDEDTDTLFAVQQNSTAAGSQDLGNHPVLQKWWKYMSDIMETNEDFSPKSTSLKEVFHLD